MSHRPFRRLLWVGAFLVSCSSSTLTGLSGSGTQPGGGDCSSNAACSSGLCVAGVCESGQPGGASCSSGSSCVSGVCQGSVCSGNGSGAPPGGACTGNDQCASATCAHGTCGPGSSLPDGKSCASAAECVSNACTNGICGSGTSGGAGGATGSSGGGGDSGSGACSSSSALLAAAGGAMTGSAPPVTCNPDAGDAPDQTGCSCTPGTSRACFNGAAGTRGVGACQDGTQVCISEGELTGTYDVCAGAVTVCTPPTPPALCSDTTVNNEPEILAAYSPASGQTVAKNGQIKVWVNDEWAPFISQGEVVDPNTGAVLTPGDRAGKAPDGYLFEPALYIAPETAESGGTPHFPQWIKGQYNNNPAAGKPMGGPMGGPKGGPMGGTSTPPTVVEGATIDPVPTGTPMRDKYADEYIWDVCALGLPPGTYNAEFVIIDGDQDRAVGCVTIVIAP